jgi:hypothetical protein
MTQGVDNVKSFSVIPATIPVIPAKAGILWMKLVAWDSRFRGNDEALPLLNKEGWASARGGLEKPQDLA